MASMVNKVIHGEQNRTLHVGGNVGDIITKAKG